MAIDIGPGAGSLGLSVLANYTCFNVENPANADGIVTTMECYFTTARTSVKMGTFYGSDSLWTNRDYESLGNCAGGSVTTFTGLNCECKAGDQIGLYPAYYLSEALNIGQGFYRYSGDTFAAGEKSYTLTSKATVALYATGISAATITTQEETDVASTSVTGNGNITDTGGSGSDVTRRGFCYMEGESGDPEADGITLYSGEVVGSTANPSIALKAFTAVNCTGLTKANGILKIDLKCDAPEKLSSTGSRLELTSSGKSDVNEWWMYLPLSEITTSYKTFYLPLSSCGSQGGELDVTAIDYIRWYAHSTDSSKITISWRNAAILIGQTAVYDDGTFGTGAYTKSITGLTPATNYRIRAYAVNITGTSYGATVQAKTSPENSFLPGHKFIPAFIGGII